MDTPNPTSSQTVEVDLIFPCNKTYAPTSLMPMVFAVQNFRVAKSLLLKFDYTIEQVPYIKTKPLYRIRDTKYTDYSGNSNHFEYDWTTKVNNTEGIWLLSWTLRALNCSHSNQAAALGASLLDPEIRASSMAMQLCQEGYDADHIFGFIATSNGSFTYIQSALRTWVKADYLSFIKSKDIVVPAYFTTPPLGSTTKSTLSGSNATAYFRRKRASIGPSREPDERANGRAVPDLKPKPNPDGSCYTHTFQAGDNCSSVAASNGLPNDDLENFNKKTWGWNGCSNVWVGTIACLSIGRPPFPPPIANAVCGPQVPGSKIPTDDSDIASLNPCPLNACCNFWGQYGTTEKFCENSAGNTAPGTNGCISNCGISIVSGTRDESFIRLGYFKGYNFSSPLYQNTLRVDASQYTHLHFAFGSITPGYEVNTGDTMTTHEFDNFKLLQGPKRILSFGSRGFSDDPEAPTIICEGVTHANRLKLATNIANFIRKHDLDGVDTDREYPSAPDTAPGSKDESQIGKIVDYIVYMTFGMHGQWDAHGAFSQSGCPSGTCLRSHVNLTETISALSMITKAGVPSNKVVIAYVLEGLNPPTQQKVYALILPDIANAGIEEILNDPARINQHYVDEASNSNILVYDSTQWVGYLSAEVKESRTALFKSSNMGGTADWAINSESYHNPNFLQKRRSSLPPSQRWGRLDCNHAWQNVINIWKTVDEPRSSDDNKAFLGSISITFNGPEGADGNLYNPSCENTRTCDTFHGKGTGAAAFLIWNSLVMVHNMYNDIDKNLQRATSDLVNSLLAMTDLLPIGTAGIGGYVFHSWKPTRDELKATTPLLIGQSTTLAKGMLDTLTLRDLFNVSDSSIATLTDIISDGKLVDGREDNQDDAKALNTRADAPMYDAGIARVVFGFAIPTIWAAARTFPFVINSGYPCGTIDPLDSFLSVETMHATASCVDDKLYYLASPKGDARVFVPYPRGSGGYYRNNKFSAPPGVELLNHGNSFKGITLDDIVKGAVNTYKQNGGRNGGKVADPSDAGTRERLVSQDITPGFIRVPVCGPDAAFKSWLGMNNKPDTTLENYPCSPLLARDECEGSTFEDQTNGGSPLVSDCMTIIKNIEGTDGQWTTQVVGKNQRQLVDYGTCKFGVEATKVNGNVAFYVGAQDVVDIITDSIKQFGKDGRIAAKGEMSCRGNVHGQNVEWGIYP
ncbi:chitinase [Trichophyton equinum CBS 127.97]|uniref:chitinase n=1 Tax=Trichophyton equinum (strain ATCC MYA-4606 / CBS 127.97) TaxID=559882 RepID=F2PXS5_TRIEC|nr:chitinase [Trichophyton equinum CBS 127.97]